ncbi:hypothetical protein KIW84_050803 [Lathyrus oleraceus]|uniref:G domain-containing protein n=1 Tax=Pisum sativum TaxID=3888 RepID=A0A9D5ACY7_PEA|nr:hypothetical protein KIW84_050803 [Pisum sativum]
MALLHLPRLSSSLSTLSSPSFSRRASRTFNTLLHPPKSTLTDSEPIQVSTITPKPETLSLEKLFVPPNTHVTHENARILNGSNILLSNYATDAKIIQADFVKSSVGTGDCPSDGLPEFALVGRSNVGKSSLLNSIVRRKNLALTSKKPGMHLRLMNLEWIGRNSPKTFY